MLTNLAVKNGGLGRFGNTCFTIAGTIGIAVKSGQPYGFPEWHTADNALFGQKVDNINDLLLNPLPAHIPEINYQEYPYFWGYRDINLPTGSWNIHAHLQSARYFEHCLPLIRHYFTFKDEPPKNDCIALHWRAGDYQDGENAYHPRQKMEYYLEAIKHFPEDSKYLIFSDDIDEAVKRFKEAGWPINIEGMVRDSTYIEDFKLMKSCHSFITANSTFSLMAAILGDQEGKKIICPAKWFGPTVNLETKDIYPEGAIII